MAASYAAMTDPLPQTPAASPGGPVPVRVVELVAEADDPREDPAELTPALDAANPGEVLVQLRRTTPRVTVGSGLARRPGLLEAVSVLPGSPRVTTTTAGGTFVVGGPGWLALSAVGRPPAGRVLPLDWMLGALRDWFTERLAAAAIPPPRAGRVDGAWCPGFSDLAVGGRKLVGLGFRVTRERVLARGTIAVSRISEADLSLLQGCHLLLDLEVRRESCTSLEELDGGTSWTADGAESLLAGP